MTRIRLVLAAVLSCVLFGSMFAALTMSEASRRLHVTAYFANTNGLYPGDQVRILGVPVGGIDSITASPSRVRVTFWFDRKFKVPAEAQAAILSPALVSARVIQLTPAYTGGPVMQDNAVIPQNRTAVPVEWDDFRTQLQKLADTLRPTTPGGTSPLGSFINAGAANMRGNGASLRESVIKLSQALSALGDHSGDLFGTVKNLSVLVTALQSSSDVLGQLNTNLSAVSGLLANDPNEVANAVTNLDSAVRDVTGFLEDTRDATGESFDKLASITTSVMESLYYVKQVLHVAPTALSNFANTYRPAHPSVAGDFVFPNFANPLQFICGSIQAASRLNYEKSAKLCAQYLAPIFKNREYNFPPVGTTAGLATLPIPIPLPLPIPIPLPPFFIPTLAATLLPIPIPVAGAMARPNEITYSEDWMRPDYHYRPGGPPPPSQGQAPTPQSAEAPGPPPQPAQAASRQTNPAAGLPGLMTPSGGGS